MWFWACCRPFAHSAYGRSSGQRSTGPLPSPPHPGTAGSALGSWRLYVPGLGIDDRVAMVDMSGSTATSVHYYATNRLGSVIGMVDSAGVLTDQYLYSPFGVEEPLSASGNPFRYTGRYYDGETGLYYYRSRYYNPGGRFLEPDSILYDGGLNLYAYVGGDPINNVDPLGTQRVPPRLRPQRRLNDRIRIYSEQVRSDQLNARLSSIVSTARQVDPSYQPPSGVGEISSSYVRSVRNDARAFVSQFVTPVPNSPLAAPGSTQNLPATFFPSNNGVIGRSSTTFLRPGTELVRFGDPAGKFVAPRGTPQDSLSLPPSNSGVATILRVVKPFPVQSGQALPAFNQRGLGTQFETPVTVEVLLKRQILEEIK